MINIIDKIISDSIESLNNKKVCLLKERLFHITGKDIDIEEESKQLFPKIVCAYHESDLSERWYWNDGSKEGRLIISFYPSETELDRNGMDISNYGIKIGFRYK